MAALDVLRCIAALPYTGRGTQRLRCIDQYNTFLRCIAAERAVLDSCCIRRVVARMVVFTTLPEELQGYCARFLDPRSAGCLGQASRAAALLVREQLVAAKAAHEAALAAAPFEKSAHGGIVTLTATPTTAPS